MKSQWARWRLKSGAVQRKHQSSVSLALVREIHRRPVMRKMFPFYDVIRGLIHRNPVHDSTIAAALNGHPRKHWFDGWRILSVGDSIDGLVQDYSSSSALAMELLRSCTKPSIWGLAFCLPLERDDTAWGISCMETSSNGNIIRVTGILCGNSPIIGESPPPPPHTHTQSSVTQSFHVCFDVRLSQRLSKQWRRRWFESPSRSLWRHCNGQFIV